MNRHSASALTQLNQQFENQPTLSLLDYVFNDELFGNVALVSSFGTQSAILLHLVAQVNADIPVLFIDTGKLFADTHSYREELIAKLGLSNLKIVGPDPIELDYMDKDGLLWRKDNNACCAIRKINPLKRELAGYDSWISGRKQFQGGLRKNLSLFELAGQHVKINPLALWSREQIDQYMDEHKLPRHPLTLRNYGSVGCEPCTLPIDDRSNDRAGRWAGQEKTECGIHLSGDDGPSPLAGLRG